MAEPFEPRIIAFLCNWCTYTGADLAGTSRLQYPPNVRVIRLMCSGALDPVYVARGSMERSRQRALLFYWKKEEWPHVREALLTWGRPDLIGHGSQQLVPPGPSFGAWTAQSQAARGGLRYDTHMGMKVERASADEEREEAWEAVASAP